MNTTTEVKYPMTGEQKAIFEKAFATISAVANQNSIRVGDMSAMNVAWAANRLMNLAAELQDQASAIVEDLKFKAKIEQAKQQSATESVS